VYPGMGALANSHLGLHNVDSEGFSHDSAGLSRRHLHSSNSNSNSNSNNSSTMIGSFSYYHGLYSVAMDDIPQGHELFVNYGDDWFLQRRAYLGDIPVATDYPIANRLIQTLAKALALDSDDGDGDDDHDGDDNTKDHNNNISDNNNNNTILHDVYQHIRNTAMDNPRIQFTLPKNLTELAQAAAVKGGIQYHHLPNVIRNEDWLRRNTYCVDHIAVNQQQVQHESESQSSSTSTAAAGRGAFATRDLPRFTIVAPLPVLPLNATYLNVTLPQHGNTKKHLLKGRQLLENYAFGNVNSKSDVYLFSYGFNTNFVNHAPTNNSSSDSDSDGYQGEDELTPPTLTANVKLQWSKRPYHKHAYTLLKPTMVTRKSFGMMLELVATRDIQQGEEILLDYGPAWEQAYQDHVEETLRNNVKDQTHTNTNNANAKYVASFELNAQGQQEGQAHWDIRTLDEEKAAAAASESKYYSPNVGMACYANPLSAPMEEEQGANAYARQQDYYYSNNTHGTLVQYLDDEWDANHAGCFMPCLILERTTMPMPIHTSQEGGYDHDGSTTASQSQTTTTSYYTVELLPTHQWDHECVMPRRVPHHRFRSPDNLGGKDPRPPFAIKVSQVPRSAIRFVDHPHTQDHYLNLNLHSSNKEESPNSSNGDSNVDVNVDVDVNLKAFRHPIGVPDDVWPAAWNN
jgi:hypothetical protein